ncbi:MAG TPA: hypothetical protein DCE18_19180 [Syntrophobacteraceae bacterium]|nr:hypothetical protein [Syntrophobacteraceae bacterium]
MAIAVLGGAVGMALAFPTAAVFSAKLGALLPVFEISRGTLLFSALLSGFIGMMSAIIPAWRATHVRVVEALRHIG